MPKERPIKSFRMEAERPFKTYNPDMSEFQEPTIIGQSLPTFASILKQQQQQYQSRYLKPQQQYQSRYLKPQQQYQSRYLKPPQQLQQDRHMNSPQLGQLTQQLYPHFQQTSQADINSNRSPGPSNYPYPNIALGSSSAPTAGRPPSVTPIGSFTQQKEHGLNIPSFTGNSTHNPNSIFNAESVNSLRPMTENSLPRQDPTPPLVNNPMHMPSFSGSQPKQLSLSSIIPQFPVTNPHFEQRPPSSFYGLSVPSTSGITSPVLEMASPNRGGQCQIKRETNEKISYPIISPRTEAIKSLQIQEQSMTFNDPSAAISARSLPSCSIPLTNSSIGKSASTAGDRSSSDEERNTDDGGKGSTYTEKRRKNNESAKRSREARRNKEEMIALTVIGLEEENMRMLAEVSLLNKELAELRKRLCECS